MDHSYSLVLFLSFILSTFLNTCGNPIAVSLNADSQQKLKFLLTLPTNDSVEVELTFKLLSFSQLVEDGEVFTSGDNLFITTSSAATAATTTLLNEWLNDRSYISLNDAIEGFRQDLIKKEKDIAGVIESSDIFYRHFQFTFDDDQAISVRCTYDSNYEKKSLSIQCYEYREYESERILSNGEVELFRIKDADYISTMEYVNVKKMKQSLFMDIN